MVHRITARSRQIGRHPYSGRMVPEYNDESIRELIEGGYRIVYILLENQIDVVSVRHRSKPLPGEPL
jgi:plasmid stabilization system protein ParE